jgi:probable phosphoglycerate mutase
VTTTVFLVRHGAHDLLGRNLCGRMEGVVLNSVGQSEAEALARRFAREPVGAVYASPLERARQTAAPIARAVGRPLTLTDALNEIDFGDWTGAEFAALQGDLRWNLWNTVRSAHRPPGGESFAEAQARVAAWLDEVFRRHPDGSVIGVCHGDLIRAALVHVLGLSLDHYDRLEVEPGSVSVVVGGEWGRKVHSINEAAR